jgi:hypothetical protein
MNNDDTPLLLAIGVTIGAALTLLCAWSVEMFDHHDFMSKYDGLETLVSEMQDDCEARPGVISCEWDEEELDGKVEI